MTELSAHVCGVEEDGLFCGLPDGHGGPHRCVIEREEISASAPSAPPTPDGDDAILALLDDWAEDERTYAREESAEFRRSARQMNLLDADRQASKAKVVAAVAALRAEVSEARDQRDEYHDERDRAADEARALRAEVAVLRQFAGKAIHATRILEIGDWDGGEMQDTMEACGLIAPVEATEPCGDDCRCAEYDDFPQTCYRLTELGRRAASAPQEEPRDG